MQPSQILSAHDRRRLSVVGTVHTETVDRYLGGGTVRSTTRTRIEQALREMGRPDLIRSDAGEGLRGPP